MELQNEKQEQKDDSHKTKEERENKLTRYSYLKLDIKKDILPRFVNFKEKYIWEQSKINYMEDLEDKLLMTNIFQGKIITSKVYPLIFDNFNDKTTSSLIKVRTLKFYKDYVSNSTIYESLNDEEKLSFCIGIRDLFFASENNLLNEEEKELVLNIASRLEDDILNIQVNGIESSPYPTKTKKMSQWVERDLLEDFEENELIYFIQNKLELYLMFIDPSDLSFHNFENIIPFDSVSNDFKKSEFELSSIEKNEDKEVFKCELKGSRKDLLKLDSYDLYTSPFNQKSRGGKRFIFSSKQLAESLKDSILKSDLLKLKSFQGFQFVNHVFRYNKFACQDGKFKSHYDTPYYDSEARQYSKYTLLIYLTGGKGNPAFKIGESWILETIPEFTCIIFDQGFIHEGQCFMDNDKIFIRSELIFTCYKNFENDPLIGKIFNMACYMTKESIFHPELSEYVNNAFNHAAKMRRNIMEKNDLKEVYLLKQWDNIQFITNGHDYWFLSSIDKKVASILIILDYFGGKIGNLKYKKLIYSKMITNKINSKVNPINFLIKNQSKKSTKEKLSKIIQDFDLGEEEPIEYGSGSDKQCCGYHVQGPYFYPDKNEEVIAAYEKRFSNLKFDQYSVYLFDNKIKINMDDIHVYDDMIEFEGTGTMNRINFAACWNDLSPKDYISETKKKVDVFSLPPIYYFEMEKGINYTIDMFQNDFIIKEESTIGIPFISDDAN